MGQYRITSLFQSAFSQQPNLEVWLAKAPSSDWHIRKISAARVVWPYRRHGSAIGRRRQQGLEAWVAIGDLKDVISVSKRGEQQVSKYVIHTFHNLYHHWGEGLFPRLRSRLSRALNESDRIKTVCLKSWSSGFKVFSAGPQPPISLSIRFEIRIKSLHPHTL